MKPSTPIVRRVFATILVALAVSQITACAAGSSKEVISATLEQEVDRYLAAANRCHGVDVLTYLTSSNAGSPMAQIVSRDFDDGLSRIELLYVRAGLQGYLPAYSLWLRRQPGGEGQMRPARLKGWIAQFADAAAKPGANLVGSAKVTLGLSADTERAMLTTACGLPQAGEPGGTFRAINSVLDQFKQGQGDFTVEQSTYLEALSTDPATVERSFLAMLSGHWDGWAWESAEKATTAMIADEPGTRARPLFQMVLQRVYGFR